MAKDLAQLRLDVRLLLDESVAADWSATQVDQAINYAYHELVTSVSEVYEDYYIKKTQLDTVEDQQEYDVATDSFPSDFFKMRRVEINYDTSNTNATPQRALPIILDDVRRDLGNENVGVAVQRNPAYYLIGMGSNLKLGFIPVPDEDGTNAITLWYYYTPTDLSATSDEIDVPYPDRYGRLISYGAAADLLRKGQQEEVAAARYRGEFELGLEKMKQQLEDRRADDVRGVTDVVNLNTWFDDQSSVPV